MVYSLFFYFFLLFSYFFLEHRLCEMLADAVGLGPNLGAAIVGALNDFRATRPILFEGDSPIAQLLRNLA